MADVKMVPEKAPGTGGEKYIPVEERTGNESIVYFTRDLSPEGLRKIYNKVNGNMIGKVAIKLHTGEKDGYLYWMGKRLEADDDYKLYTFDGKTFYLVNTKGKLQKSTSKKFDIDMPNGGTLEDVKFDIAKKTYVVSKITEQPEGSSATLASLACVPHIALCDDWVIANVGSGTNKYEIIPEQSDDFVTLAEAKALMPKFGDEEEEDDDEE